MENKKVKKGQKIRTVYGEIETVMSCDLDGFIKTYEHPNYYIHPTKYFIQKEAS